MALPVDIEDIQRKQQQVAQLNDDLEFLRKCSEALLDEGSLDQAAETLEKLVLALEKTQAENPEDLIDVLEKLGACYFGMQDYVKTVSVYSRLVMTLDGKFGMDHLETIKAVYKLAKSCEKAGQGDQAQTMYYIARESSEKTLPEGHYLRQSIAESYQSIVKARRVKEKINKFVAGDLQDPKALVKAAKSIPQTFRGLSTRGDILLSIVASLLLVIGSGAWVALELKRKEVPQTSQATTVALNAATTRDARDASLSNSFSSTDRFLQLRFFNEKEAELECEGKVLKLDVVTLTDSLDSVGQLFHSALGGNRVWAELTADGLKTDGDLKLFSLESQEMKLVQAVDLVAKTLNDYYKEHGSYPDGKADLIATGKLSYMNPVTGRSQSVSYQNFSQFMQLDHLFSGAKTREDVVKFLRSGGRWGDEPDFAAGAIQCVSRYSGERRGEDFIVPTAFLHVADKNRQLLPGTVPGEVLLVVLEKGSRDDDSSQRLKIVGQVLTSFQGKTLYFVKSQGLFTNAWLWRNLVTILLAAILLASISWWFVFDARSRLQSRAKPPVLSEMFTILIAVLFLGWIVFALIFRP
jgi:tetratricopeptide (TPR) repeat protein